MTFERFAKLIPAEQIYIVSNLAYKELICNVAAISENQVLLEPLRNTAHASLCCTQMVANRLTLLFHRPTISFSTKEF